MHATDYEAVIIGSRVAGASLAIWLGKQGARVLLIDKARFPSDTISTHLMVLPAVEALARLGVLPALESSGLRRLTRIRTWLDDCLIEGPIGATPTTYGLAPRRNHLDYLLIQQAREYPSVTFLPSTRATGLLWHDNRVVGVAIRHQGTAQTVTASVVIGADGVHSEVARWTGAAQDNVAPALRAWYYAYLHHVTPLPEPAVENFYQGDDIAFIFPMEPGIDCVGIGLRLDDLETFKTNIPDNFTARLGRFPTLASRLQDAQRDGKIFGSAGIPNFTRQAFGPGWALVGDAAYAKDPSTGLGIGDALLQSEKLAPCLMPAFAGAAWDKLMEDYQAWRDGYFTPQLRWTVEFASRGPLPPESLVWLRALYSHPAMLRALAAGFPTVATVPGLLSDADRMYLTQAVTYFGNPYRNIPPDKRPWYVV